MRTLAILLAAVPVALAQNFTIPKSVQFEICIFPEMPPDVVVEIKSETGDYPFTVATNPRGWLRVKPTSGTVTPAGVSLTLSVAIEPQPPIKGKRLTYLAFLVAGQTYMIPVESSCFPTPTLNVSVSELRFSVLQGRPSELKSFLVSPNVDVFQPSAQDPLVFDITWDTPFRPPWIGFAGTVEGNGRGKIQNSNPVSVEVGVDAKSLPVGRTTGYMQITDTKLEGTDAVEIIVDVAADTIPVISPNGISDAAAGRPILAPGAWASIYGIQLAPDTAAAGRSWLGSEIVNGRLPTTLDAVSVSIGNRAAAIAYISNSQVNFLVPSDLAPGAAVPVSLKTSKGTSSPVNVNVQDYAPNLFTFIADSKRYAAAQHADYATITSANPARPGETILIYATGFGRTNPATPPGVVVGSGATVVAPVTVRIGGITATAQAFFSGVGLYQLNVTIPDNLLNGEHAVIATAGGIETQSGVVLPIRR
jgi:uncharacterized protein (TIGR03437 family)